MMPIFHWVVYIYLILYIPYIYQGPFFPLDSSGLVKMSMSDGQTTKGAKLKMAPVPSEQQVGQRQNEGVLGRPQTRRGPLTTISGFIYP